jgi:hypothetical protein
MEMIHTLCSSLFLVAVALAQRSARGAGALIGTWRLLELADLDKNGKWQYRKLHGDTSFTMQPGTCTFRS